MRERTTRRRGDGLLEEGCWKKFFLDPTQWWDDWFDKPNPRGLHFRNKLTNNSYWIDNNTTPSCVREKFRSRQIRKVE